MFIILVVNTVRVDIHTSDTHAYIVVKIVITIIVSAQRWSINSALVG